jgi:phage regulator Rha-like protein
MARANIEYSRPAFGIADLNTSIDGTPRMMDLTLAEALGFARASNIRRIISRHVASLRRFGEVCSTMEQTMKNKDNLGGRPGKAYYLNKKQALYICTKSETENATEVTIQMVEVFDAYTSGKPVHVREHDRRTSTKIDDALKLKKNIDRLESVVATLDVASIQPAAQPNFCAMVIDGEHVFVDINRFDGHGRAVVIQHDGKMRIQNVEPDAHNLRTFGARSALGERYKSPHGGTMRNSVAIVGMVMEPHIDDKRQGYVNDVTDKLRDQITTLLEAGPFTDIQIAKRLCCNPKFVNEVRKVQSHKPADMSPVRVIDHEPKSAPYRDRVIAMIRQGYGNAAIASQLGCSTETVRRHKVRMLAG